MIFLCNCLKIHVPHTNLYLTPECKIKLSRFTNDMWQVKYGWYTWGGNRSVCGWYLVSMEDKEIKKPLQRPDLDDIYIIEN